MRVLGVGRTEWLYDSLVAAIEAEDYELAGIVTAPAAPEYRRGVDDFRDLARRHGVPFIVARRIDERTLALIGATRPDVALSVNWLSILGGEVFDAFPHGILNAHLGDLPRFRGNACGNWALVVGEPSVTLSVHRMAPDVLDAGEVFAQATMELNATTSIRDINAFIGHASPGLFLEALDRIRSGRGPQFVTDEAGGFRCYPRLPRDGLINWSAPAIDIDRLVRALAPPYPSAYTFYRDDHGVLRRLRVLKSSVVEQGTDDLATPGHVLRNDAETGEAHIMAGRGVIALHEVVEDDDEPFEPGTRWRSIRMRLGLDLHDELFRVIRRLEDD